MTHSSYIPSQKIQEHITQSVMHRIQRARTHERILYGSLHAVISVGAIVALLPAITYLTQEATMSGFWSYLSLSFSDSSLVLSDVRTFALSIAESLPIIGSVACLTILLILTNSIRRGYTYVRRSPFIYFAS